ncbi:MAG TPA: methyltransferase domain-containing protein [Vicinamibacterales bacterium]|nr:methyltransferase domain-containing protein [Vicinamibacterales bacterium]
MLRKLSVLVTALVVVGLTQVAPAAQSQAVLRDPDVIFVPTPQSVVDAMLKLAGVTKDDVVYDLGCGDGRIVVTAAKQFGARGVGIDIDPKRIQDSNKNAVDAGVTDRVKFMHTDIFADSTNLSEATVVTLYLLPSLNVRLLPKLRRELKPGTRIVSNSFAMGDWKADKTVEVDGRTIYFWTMPKS